MTELSPIVRYSLGSRQHVTALLADAATVLEPLDCPEPHGVMAPDELEQVRREGPQNPLQARRAASAAAYLSRRADTLQRNRKRLGVLLWAADTLRDLKDDDPLFDEYAGPITRALSMFGFRGDIPRGPSARRTAVEQWGQP